MVRARRPAVQRNRQAAAPRAQGRTGGSGLRRIESADMTGPDHLDADRLSAPGGQPVLVVDAAGWRRPLAPIQAVVIGIDREGALPTVVARPEEPRAGKEWVVTCRPRWSPDH